MSKVVFVLSKYLVVHWLVSPRHQAIEEGRPESVTNPGVNYEQLLIVARTHLWVCDISTSSLLCYQYCCYTVDK